jgi:hypothetical protein
MKSIIVKSGLIAAALVVGAAAAARADSLDVKVPFPFEIHGQTLPAGEYRVNTDGRIVQLRGEHGNKSSAIFITSPASGQDPAGETPVLIFTRDETQYRLADVWESAFRGGVVVN